jgi:HEAT repeat protein
MKIKDILTSVVLAMCLLPSLVVAEDPSSSSIVDRLKSSEYSEQLSAIAQIEKMDEIPREYIEPLLALVKEPLDKSSDKTAALTFAINHKATLLLSRTGDSSIDVLREMMKVEELRWKTVEILQRMGKEALPALPELIDALQDDNKHVRYFAAKSIMQFGKDGAAAVPSLILLVDDDHDSAREFAIKALGKIGAASAPALPALRKALKHDKFLTKAHAEDSIESIEMAISVAKEE